MHYVNGYRVVDNPLEEPSTGIPAQAGQAPEAEPQGLVATAGRQPERRRGNPHLPLRPPEAFMYAGAYEETAKGSASEVSRVRRVIITFHPEDGALSVRERAEANTGLVHGTVVRRTRGEELVARGAGVVPAAELDRPFSPAGRPWRPSPPEGEAGTAERRRPSGVSQSVRQVLEDVEAPLPGGLPTVPVSPHSLLPGAYLLVSGLRILVLDADPLTRQLLSRDVGVELPQAVDPPAPVPAASAARDPARAARDREDARAARVAASRPRGPPQPAPLLRRVEATLTFLCLWDDTGSLYGDRRTLRVRYFVGDSTAEVVEHVPGGGVRPFLKRAPLWKVPGETPVGLSDLLPGRLAVIHGRTLLAYDMDDFTRAWLRDQHGISPRDLEAVHVGGEGDDEPEGAGGSAVRAGTGGRTTAGAPHPEAPAGPRAAPSAGRLSSATPRHPRACAARGRASGAERAVLHLGARIAEPTDDAESRRQFLVSFHVADGTLAVYERPGCSAGIAGGPCISRARVTWDDVGGEGAGADGGLRAIASAPDPKLAPRRPLEAEDLTVGATIRVRGRAWTIIDADDYTLALLEAREGGREDTGEDGGEGTNGGGDGDDRSLPPPALSPLAELKRALLTDPDRLLKFRGALEEEGERAVGDPFQTVDRGAFTGAAWRARLGVAPRVALAAFVDAAGGRGTVSLERLLEAIREA